MRAAGKTMKSEHYLLNMLKLQSSSSFMFDYGSYMTPFGGYRWRPFNPDECYVPKLDLLPHSLVESFEHVKPRCTAVLPTLFGTVESQHENAFAQTPKLFHPLLLLERFCYNLTAFGKHSSSTVYRLIDRIYETIINHRLPGRKKIR
ncbi:hypothetical protein P879_04408 [Paragonimus westermani]|uniref:Uncharacterized protein n=1 Tax=Paragonimus westermani TaxID=34504 RepID=A0A8T0DFH8_9TREM|nr:hypothetical protein P879_04408 [Paragonimus westermani]